MSRISILVGICLALAPCALPQATMSAAPSPHDKQVIAEFHKRVDDYLALRKQRAGTSPAPTNSAEKLAQRQKELAAKVRAARPNAKQGDIFTPAIADYFRKQIATTLSGAQGARIRASLRHAEPVHGLALQVNSVYPPKVPLQSTAPSLLASLPELPKELEYRIVGHDLVLHDIAADIVVDFLPGAVPGS
jgi:hypothetical protein